MRRPRHVLIVVQNLPVPLDRRVWLECLALRDKGYAVSVICPRGPEDLTRETLEGVAIFRYAPAPEARSLVSYAFEFAYSWMRTFLLSFVVWRRAPFHALQACNPPDTYWALALVWRLRGVRFVFDQHDLNPELFLSRFGQPTSFSGRVQLRALLLLERMTYRTARHVISTNESYRRVALTRGELPREDTTVVRSGPDTARMRPVLHSVPREPGSRVLVYLGIMGPQDGVDTVLHVVKLLRDQRGRTDVRAVLMGFGDCLEDLRRECDELDLEEVVTFTGRVGPSEIAQHLSAADIGLCPDAKTPLNDVSTMNKTMEYMAYCLPSVSFDLVETRVSAGDTALYAPSGDLEAFADAIERLLDDDELRVSMGLAARERVASQLDWREQATKYVAVYERLLGPSGGSPRSTAGAPSHTQAGLVDLDDLDDLKQFIRDREGRLDPRETA
jgi:glycosyltransferase involved in cell wall biosynthesis